MGIWPRAAGVGVLAGCALGVLLAASPAQTGDPNAACLSDLKQVSVGLLMYVQDYDEKLPLMKTVPQVQNRLRPYVRKNEVFTCPVVHKAYQPNDKLSYRRLATFPAPASTWTFRDAQPHPDALWSVAFLDGHVRRAPKLPVMPGTAPRRPAPRRH